MKVFIFIFILCIINNCYYLNFAHKNNYNNNINNNIENVDDINTLDKKINEIRYYLSQHPDEIKENKEQNAEIYKQLGLILHVKDVKFHVGGGILQNDALQSFNKALDLGHNNLPLVIYVNQHKGLLLKMMGKGEEAVISHEIAYNLSSTNRDKSMAIHHKGNALVMIGKVREAIDIFKEALRLAPSQLGNYLQLVECYKELGEFSKLEWKNFFYEIEDNVRSFNNGLYPDDYEDSILDKSNNIGSEVYWALFGAGRNAELNKAAWENLEKARDIEKQSRNLDSSSFQSMQQVDYVKNIFTPSFFQGFETIGLKTKTPIFIVGMMRSGSTLVETMLDSHKDMWGMGEDSIFNANLA
jgi:tetratricopeptide (TPR) repeat protein